MDQPQHRQYLVEHYVPGLGQTALEAMSGGLAQAAAAAAASGERVRYLGSTFVPVEDSCFSWFEGPSEDTVRRLLDALAFPYARILATESLRP
jgi:hypothetical protein